MDVMTEKESTLNKLTSFSWQRKLNERNSFPKCVSTDYEHFWKHPAKPNSESQHSNENKKQLKIHQTHVFKAKNDFKDISTQNRDDRHYVKLQTNETINDEEFATVKETSNAQIYERQLKNENAFGRNYGKAEKENVNIHKAKPSKQIHVQNQKHVKQNDKSQSIRREGYSFSSNYVIERDNSMKKDQRNFTHNQSKNYFHNNRGHHRYQEKPNHQSNYQRNDTKYRNNYQSIPRHQYFHRSDNQTEQSSPDYSKSGIDYSSENSSKGIHYQNAFSFEKQNKYCNTNVTSKRTTKSEIGEMVIYQNEVFAQLDEPLKICTSDAENVFSRTNNNFVSNQFTNFPSVDDFSTDIFSDNFTAGISEPIPVSIPQKSKVQLNQSTNIPSAAVNFIDSYTPSNDALISDNFHDRSYASEIIATSTPSQSDRRQLIDCQFTPGDIPTTLSSLSPEVADFVPRRNRIPNVNEMKFSNPVVNLQNHNSNDTYLFSSPNNNLSQNPNWSSQNNISDFNETMNFGSKNRQPSMQMQTGFNQNNPNSEPYDIFKQHSPAPDTSSSGQIFNFNGRIVNLIGKNNQTDVNEHLPFNEISDFNSRQDDSIDCPFPYNFNTNSSSHNYSENLGLNNQQMSNILQIASLNLNEEPSLISGLPSQTNASFLSQTVINDSSITPMCEAMQNSRVNVIQDYFKKPTADVVYNFKCNESDEMDSKLTIVAHQLFNVNKYVTSAEINGGTVTTKDSVCDLNSRRFNAVISNRNENELEKYQCKSFSHNGGANALLSSNDSKTHYERLFLPTSIHTSRSFDSFSPQIFPNSNFIASEEQQFNTELRCNSGNLTNNPVLPTDCVSVSNTKLSEVNAANDFQNNYLRTSTPASSLDYHHYVGTTTMTITPSYNRSTSFKNEVNRNYVNRKMFNNQVHNKPANSMTIHVRDDSLVNFNRKVHHEDSGDKKFNAILARTPSVGILKKSPKPVVETSIQFQKSPPRTTDVSLNDNSPPNKKVSFLLENDQ